MTQREAFNEYHRWWRKNNKEKVLAYRRKEPYRDRRKYYRQYRATHKEQIRSYQKAYRLRLRIDKG